MSSKDSITKTYMRNNAIFADAFNFYIYSGEQIIKPDDLQELDVTESAVISTSDTNNSRASDIIDSHQRYRDVLKSAVIKQHGDTIYAVLGIENQSDINYAMPVRNLIYDGLQYSKQIQQASAKHKTNHTQLSRGEFLSGLRKEDKLTPVITLVLYFGVDSWDGARSIHEMLSTNDPKLLKYVQNYQINLIEPASISAAELDSFTTSLREVLGYIKYANDKDKLLSFVTAKQDMVIDIDAARVINVITKTHIDIPDDAKEVNMCKAIEDLINDSKAEGRLEGRKEGITEGKHEGYIDAMMGLVRDNLLSVKDAAVRVGMTEDAFATMLRK